jgi:hypothetical protein
LRGSPAALRSPARGSTEAARGDGHEYSDADLAVFLKGTRGDAMSAGIDMGLRWVYGVYGDGVDGAPTGIDVPRWSLSQAI